MWAVDKQVHRQFPRIRWLPRKTIRRQSVQEVSVSVHTCWMGLELGLQTRSSCNEDTFCFLCNFLDDQSLRTALSSQGPSLRPKAFKSKQDHLCHMWTLSWDSRQHWLSYNYKNYRNLAQHLKWAFPWKGSLNEFGCRKYVRITKSSVFRLVHREIHLELLNPTGSSTIPVRQGLQTLLFPQGWITNPGCWG